MLGPNKCPKGSPHASKIDPKFKTNISGCKSAFDIDFGYIFESKKPGFQCNYVVIIDFVFPQASIWNNLESNMASKPEPGATWDLQVGLNEPPGTHGPSQERFRTQFLPMLERVCKTFNAKKKKNMPFRPACVQLIQRSGSNLGTNTR